MAYPPFHAKHGGQIPLTMTRMELGQAFPSESEHAERKAGTSGKPLQEAAVAFSNTDGGVVLIGVKDDGEVLGRELTPGTADDIHRVMREIHDPGAYEIHSLLVDGTPITVLEIRKRSEGFAQTSDGRVLVRRGRNNVSLIGAELRRFLNERTFHRFEDTPLDVAISKGRRRLISEVAEAFEWSDPRAYRERLREEGLAENGRLTVAGALYLLDDPASELGKSYVEIFRYPEGESEYDRRVEFRGPLQQQLKESVEFIQGELGEELVILGVRRHSSLTHCRPSRGDRKRPRPPIV